MPNTFSKAERLKKGEFRVIRWTKYGESAHFLLLGSKNRKSVKRIAVAVRKKTGGAVARNRVKRLIREFFRLQKDLFLNCHDNLIRVKKMPPRLAWRETQEELRQLLLGVNSR